MTRRMRLWVWMLSGMVCGMMAAGTAHAEIAWKMIVVFEIRDKQRQYAGVVSERELPARLGQVLEKSAVRFNSSVATETFPSFRVASSEYEMWFVADGLTTALSCQPSRKTFHLLQDTRKRKCTAEEARFFQKAIAEMKFDVRRPQTSSASNACYPSEPSTLKTMVEMSHLIVAGRTVGILREAPTPINHPTTDSHHSVFVVAVEQTIKPRNAAIPAVIKVYQIGDSRFPADPLLTVGERGIFFLHSSALDSSQRGEQPFASATVDGITGKSGDWDEYILIHPLSGYVSIINDRTSDRTSLPGALSIEDYLANVPRWYGTLPEAVTRIRSVMR